MIEFLLTWTVIISLVFLIRYWLKKNYLPTAAASAPIAVSEEELAISKQMLEQTPAQFAERLEKIKATFPFDYWYEDLYKECGMEQYTLANCRKAEAIMNELISGLKTIGLAADNTAKLKLFKKAVLAYNDLTDSTDGALIETGEREDLCEIIDEIGLSCGLIPETYGDGDGIASEWRRW